MLNQVAPTFYSSSGRFGNTSILAFDLDWTLTRPTKGRFSKGVDDWNFLPKRLEILKKYTDLNHTLAIFSNQHYKGAALQTALQRINTVIQKLNVHGIYPFVFVATGEDQYRKPNTGMWDYFTTLFPPEWTTVSVLYCGDAAGRVGDFSDSDKEFAKNINAGFFLPQDIFRTGNFTVDPKIKMYIFQGMPGVGKTTFYQNNLVPLGYVHINQDTLKTKAKVLKAIETALSQGQSVAIDATNPSIATRAEYIALANKYGVSAAILSFVSSGYERNKLREKPVPEIAYSMYYKNLQEPSQQNDNVPIYYIET